MRTHLSHLTIAIAISALGFASGACSGRTTAVNMTEERAKSAANENPNQRLELIGCVKAAETPGIGKSLTESFRHQERSCLRQVRTAGRR